LKWVETLNHFATFGTEPNLTILLDVSEKVGTARIRQRLKEDVWLQGVKKRVKLDRIDSEKIEFHREVRKGFLKLAKMHSKRIQIVSGESEVSTVHEEVKALILKRMGRLPLWKKKLSKAI
jgi:dTMP kinase